MALVAPNAAGSFKQTLFELTPPSTSGVFGEHVHCDEAQVWLAQRVEQKLGKGIQRLSQRLRKGNRLKRVLWLCDGKVPKPKTNPGSSTMTQSLRSVKLRRPTSQLQTKQSEAAAEDSDDDDEINSDLSNRHPMFV